MTMSAPRHDLSLSEQLQQALQALPSLPVLAAEVDDASASPVAQTTSQRFARIAVAYSGGLDSAVLLHLAAAYAREHGVQLLAFHIHHGLSANADDWQQHCRQHCAALEVAFDTRNITLAHSDKSGVEEAARLGRYHALSQLCREHEVGLLLTAHHLDDQAETVLLQMLRGSGVAGMSGMDQANVAAALLGNDRLLLARPLLAAARAQLEQYASTHGVAFVEDESNQDTRYARNALRRHVMPALANFFPGFQERFMRAAGHAQAAQRLLVTLAQQDLATCLDGEYLSVPALRRLDFDRLDNLLRYWIALRGLRMPSAAWLLELRTQLLEAKEDAQLCVTHPDCHIRRYRERVFLTPRQPAFDQFAEPQEFLWQGQAALHFPRFAGTLFFDHATHGFDPAWLRTQAMSVRLRSGGERVRLAWNRPAKSLKYHFQSLDIPAWERTYLPLVFAAEQLLYAAGIGMDCQAQRRQDTDVPVDCIALRWQPDLK
jgi:tRNA(Ile)-lysidine synthase